MENTKVIPTSESDIHEILSYIQKELKVNKDIRNEFGGFNYRNAEQILCEVKKLLPTGVVLPIDDDIINIGDRYYVQATATLATKTQKISVKAYAREPLSKTKMDDAQVTGSSSSYARKYALQGLFAIDDGSLDPDAHNNSENKEDIKPKEEPSTAMFTGLGNCSDCGAPMKMYSNGRPGCTKLCWKKQ